MSTYSYQIPSGYLTGVAGTQGPGPPSAASPGITAGSWELDWNTGARTPISFLIWDAACPTAPQCLAQEAVCFSSGYGR